GLDEERTDEARRLAVDHRRHDVEAGGDAAEGAGDGGEGEVGHGVEAPAIPVRGAARSWVRAGEDTAARGARERAVAASAARWQAPECEALLSAPYIKGRCTGFGLPRAG